MLTLVYVIFDSYFRGKVHKISPMADLNKRAQNRKPRSNDAAKLPEKKNKYFTVRQAAGLKKHREGKTSFPL